MATSAIPPLPDFCSLETFHQLLSDSLMPWLPENNDVFFYKAWQNASMRPHGTYFSMIRRFYASGKRPLPAALESEWRLFEKLTVDVDAQKITLSVPEAITGNTKQIFYFQLVCHTFLHSYSLLVKMLQERTDDGQRYELHQLLRRLQSLQQKSREVYIQHGDEDGMIIYWIHLLLQVLQKEIVRRYPRLLMQGQTLLPFQPLSHARKDETMDSLGGMMEKWYQQQYPALRLSYMQKPKTEPPKPQTTTALTAEDTTETKPQESNKPASVMPSGPQLSSDEAASRLGISRTTLIAHAKAGHIRFVKIGRLYKFSEESIRNYLEAAE